MLTLVIPALLLAFVSNFLVAAGLALWAPTDDIVFRVVGAGGTLTRAAAAGTSAGGRVSVQISSDGDHLKPWHLLLTRPGASREVWFEKGRVYNDVSRLPNNPLSTVFIPTGARPAAVSCWSFATTCRGASPTKAALPADESISELTEASPPRAWGVAIDERGWPFNAFRARIVGTMTAAATPGTPVPSEPWEIHNGIDVDGVTKPGTFGQTNSGRTAHLGNIRVIPLQPVWTGLTLNLLIHGMVWLLTLMLVARWVGARRARRGGCPSCGYDLSGQRAGAPAGCPECGWGRAPAVTHRA